MSAYCLHNKLVLEMLSKSVMFRKLNIRTINSDGSSIKNWNSPCPLVVGETSAVSSGEPAGASCTSKSVAFVLALPILNAHNPESLCGENFEQCFAPVDCQSDQATPRWVQQPGREKPMN